MSLYKRTLQMNESEEIFRQICTYSKDAIIMINNESNITFWNDASEKIFGYSSEDAIGIQLCKLIIPERLHEAHMAGFEKFKETGQGSVVGKTLRLSAVRKDGAEFPVSLSLSAVLIKDKWNAIGIVRDITERKKIDDQLLESEKHKKQLLNSLKDGIYQCEPHVEGVFTWVNQACAEMFGYKSAEEMIGTKVKYVYANGEERMRFIERLVKEGFARNINALFKKKNGECFFVERTSHIMRDEKGKPVRIEGIIRDITERKESERRLNAQHSVTRVLSESSTLKEASQNILQAVCEALNWDFGVVWMHNSQDNVLYCTETWQNPNIEISEFKEQTKGITFSPGIGLPGRVWSSGKPAWIIDVIMDKNFPRAASAKKAGLHGAFGFPIIINKVVLGTIEFFSNKPQEPDNNLLNMMSAVGNQVAQFIKRNQAINDLIESEEKLNKITSAANDAIIMLNNDEEVSYWNEASERIFGYSKREVLGEKISNLIVPERYRDKHLEGFNKFKNIGTGNVIGKSVEVEAVKKNGDEIPIELSLSSVQREGKWNAIGIIRDISERKQDEEKIRKLSRAVEQSPSIIVITDTKGKIEYVNPKFSQLTEYPFEEAIGKNPRVLNSGKQSTAFYKKMWKTITSGKEWHGEFCNKKKSGELYWESASISPIKDSEGIITHFIANKEDITEKKLTEEKLLESEEQFRLISSSAKDAIIMLDNNEKVCFWNEASEKIFGFSKAEAIAENLYNLIIPERYRKQHIEGYDRFKDIGTGDLIGQTIEVEAIKKDGTEISIELSLSAVMRGGKWNAIGIIRDISDRKQIEQELRMSHKMMSVGRLTASVFHEVLNPVNIISSHTQLLLMEAEKGSRTEEDLRSIQDEIGRIVKITDSLRAISSREEGKAVKVEINDLLENTLTFIKPELNIKGITPVLKLEKELPEAMAHGDEIGQAFINIVSNAIEAMPGGGTLTIITQHAQKKGLPLVRIKIIDTGCGIAEDVIDKIFEPFFSTKKEIKGVGLGLSSSYTIINGCGGKLSVESEEGNGSTFIIDLPIKL